MKPYWIGTSWKMHKTLAEGLSFADALADTAPSLDARIQPFVIPSFTAIREVKQALASTQVKVGAQNMHWADEGAWTGEVSPIMLTDCGMDLVEIGHSERRAHFGETDHAIGLKTAAAVRHGLIPLICVGETHAEQESGCAEDVLTRQVTASLQFLGAGGPTTEILFAYEPVWAIGERGTPASSGYADQQHALIKAVAASRLLSPPSVLYGGSVNVENAADLIRQPNIDGLFVGRSAWQAEDYIQILKIAAASIDG